MSTSFLGYDHIDVRVPSLARVESFYDALMPHLGLARRATSFVDERGEWHDRAPGEPYNVVEYFEETDGLTPARFIGFIEDPGTIVSRTRIAFAAATPDDVRAWAPRLEALGAREIELSDDFDAYPAVFFEDPAGLRLEVCARMVKAT